MTAPFLSLRSFCTTASVELFELGGEALSQVTNSTLWLSACHSPAFKLRTNSLRVYPIKLMGDTSNVGHFVSVLHILSGGPIQNYYLWPKSHLNKFFFMTIILWDKYAMLAYMLNMLISDKQYGCLQFSSIHAWQLYLSFLAVLAIYSPHEKRIYYCAILYKVLISTIDIGISLNKNAAEKFCPFLILQKINELKAIIWNSMEVNQITCMKG